MYRDFTICVVCPAGRKRYLELLIPQVLGYGHVVDEFRMWVNTKDQGDIEYIQHMSDIHPKITCEYHVKEYGIMNNTTICHFFKNTIDTNTIYVRFDDDIVLIDSLENFKKFLDFRIDNPEYFLVFANILNNAVTSHLHQRAGSIEYDKIINYSSICEVGLRDPKLAEKIHTTILDAGCDLSSFKSLSDWICMYYERVSINCISWFGKEFIHFHGHVGDDEELWLTTVKPKELQRPNVIYHGYNIVHYAFGGSQRDYLDTTNILGRYRSFVLAIKPKVVVKKRQGDIVGQLIKTFDNNLYVSD